MNKKIHVAVLFGGKSGEHEVSLHSAASVIQAMDPSSFEVLPILINRDGGWESGKKALPALDGKMEPEQLENLEKRVSAQNALPAASGRSFPSLNREDVDAVFPVLHGTFGEDGTIQGLLEIADIPYVGAGVMASAVGMDKVMMKKIFAQEGLPQGAFTHYFRSRIERDVDGVVREIEEVFGYPCFVKPANLGSSVGISKAKDRSGLAEALSLAARYDRKIIVEEFIQAREVEVAILGNESPEASVPGEIVSSGDFYDYRAKYVDGISEMRIPVDLPQETAEKIRRLAIRAFQAIDGTGLARVDFFFREKDGQVLINEINTMPGFTPYSMYANLWEHSGISYPELVTRLIDLAMERYEEKRKSTTAYELK
ncbi:D-alanine--D-alanine ligase [Paludifilum halophilum]|uniref:D-alanine--D-alanine ligase n=1 Tax=Paludifilum halophilum TaxID=1642702 RepID=A0A235B8H8_9BACL|nr:D-alanine--D-alanine ligase [Paludifilum halophilum]OYD08289.1 D-alanine--D-alanine ligase A [Paludifilum halophilum]